MPVVLIVCVLFLTSCAHRQLDPISWPNWKEGNEVKTLIDGREFYPAMLSAIRSAKKSITFETFAYVDSPIATTFTEALTQKAVEGVKVRLILDEVGSRDLSAVHLDLLRKAGAQVYLYRPFRWFRLLHSNNRTHRKILIVDGSTAFTGGAGIAEAWETKWRDTQYLVRGPAVRQLQKSFVENWKELSGETLRGIDYFPPLPSQGRLKATFISDTISNDSNPLATGVLDAIQGVQKNLLLEQSYFVPNVTFRKALLEAATRGVKIEIIVPSDEIDSKATRYASQQHWRSYLKAGIRLYQYQGAMMHAKLLVADGRLTVIGSANLDDRSFFLNDEVNLHIDSPAFANTQERVFRNDLKSCREITLANLESVLAPWPKRFFAGLIAPQL